MGLALHLVPLLVYMDLDKVQAPYVKEQLEPQVSMETSTLEDMLHMAPSAVTAVTTTLDLTDSEDSVMTTHSAALVTTTVAGPATEATVMASPASAMAGASAVVMASASSVTCAVPALVAQVPPGALLLHLPGRLPVQAANNQQLLSHLGPYQQW